MISLEIKVLAPKIHWGYILLTLLPSAEIHLMNTLDAQYMLIDIYI